MTSQTQSSTSRQGAPKHRFRDDDELYWPEDQETFYVTAVTETSENITMVCEETGRVVVVSAPALEQAFYRDRVRLRRYEELCIPDDYE